ncbi:MAG: hypothetical protein ACKVIQ_15140 [Acidimicrobiales bacterium]
MFNLLEPGGHLRDVGQLIGRSAPVEAVVLEDATVLVMEAKRSWL